MGWYRRDWVDKEEFKFSHNERWDKYKWKGLSKSRNGEGDINNINQEDKGSTGRADRLGVVKILKI